MAGGVLYITPDLRAITLVIVLLLLMSYVFVHGNNTASVMTLFCGAAVFAGFVLGMWRWDWAEMALLAQRVAPQANYSGWVFSDTAAAINFVILAGLVLVLWRYRSRLRSSKTFIRALTIMLVVMLILVPVLYVANI